MIRAASLRSLDAAAAARLNAAREAAMGVFAAAGFDLVEPSVVTPAEIFLERLGERFRRQTCFFEDGTGQELCLRPEITIPVCRLALDGGYDGTTELKQRYAGSVFRLAQDGAGALTQSAQAGVEFLAGADAAKADATIIALTLQALAACGIGEARVVLGDAGAFTDVLDGLELNDRQRTRLLRLFDAYGSGLPEKLVEESGEAAAQRRVGLDMARAEVESELEARKLTLTGGRTVEDVARRLADRAGRAQAQHLPPSARRAIEGLFMRFAPLANAGERMRTFFDGIGIASGTPDRLAALNAALAAAGVDPAIVSYDARVHAPLGYYTGLEFRIEANGVVVAGGGRYDALIGELAGKPDWRVPAVGAALFLDAVAGLA